MAYTRDWDETVPDDNQYGSTTGPWFRKTKIDIAERLKAWIYGFISGETVIGLKKAPFFAQSSAPDAEWMKGMLYAKQVDGVVELFYKDDQGNEIQLTTNGNVNGWQFRSGDLLFSSNTTAPPGWTDVSTTYENKFIRISSGTPLETGGSDTHSHGAGSYALPQHIHTILANNKYSYSYSASGTYNGRLGIHVGDAGIYETTRYFISSDISTTSAGGGNVTGTSASAENIPAYVQVRVYKKD